MVEGLLIRALWKEAIVRLIVLVIAFLMVMVIIILILILVIIVTVIVIVIVIVIVLVIIVVVVVVVAVVVIITVIVIVKRVLVIILWGFRWISWKWAFWSGGPVLASLLGKVLVTIFSRHESLRGSVVQEFLSRAPRLTFLC